MPKVVEKTPKGRGKRGEILWHRAIVNQDGKTVQEGDVVTLMSAAPLVRPAPKPRSAERGTRNKGTALKTRVHHRATG